MVNRTQALVLGFFLLVWVGLVVILAVAPQIYDEALPFSPGGQGPVELAFLAALSAWIGLLGIGALRRWRWTFWLILVAFLAGGLRLPASLLELMGVLPTGDPTWYVLFQASIGLVQFAIGLAMLAGYRRAGIWGA